MSVCFFSMSSYECFLSDGSRVEATEVTGLLQKEGAFGAAREYMHKPTDL